MNRFLLIFLIAATSISTSCNKDEGPGPIEGTSIILSGYESGTYELDATYHYYPGNGTSPTSLNINISKIGTHGLELVIFLNEFGVSEGFDVGVYSLFDDPENLFYDVQLKKSGKSYQILGPEITGVDLVKNQVEFTDFTEENIKGRFEANISSANFEGGYDQIDVSGTFDATRVY